MVLWAALIGGDRYCNIFHADKMKYYMLSAFSLPNKQMFEFIMTVGRTCGWLVARMRVCIGMNEPSRKDYMQHEQIQNRGIDEYPILFEF